MMDKMQEKYQQAVLQIGVAGVVVKENYMSCCRSCAIYEMDVTEDTDLAWTFAGPGTELIWKRGRPMNVEEGEDPEEDEDGNEISAGYDEEIKPAEDVYWYHSGGLKAPTAIAKAFTDAGFEIVWDGTAAKAVLVKFQ
jgi:hypothetical protein